MPQPAGTSLLDHFAALDDPRQAAKVLYPLPEILLLLLSATLAGADDCVEIEFWGNEQLAFLRRFLPYRHGIPSHDTLGEVISALDPTLFKACFVSWVEGLREAEPDLIAIDGKTSRRGHAPSRGREPLHLHFFLSLLLFLFLGRLGWFQRSGDVELIEDRLGQVVVNAAIDEDRRGVGSLRRRVNDQPVAAGLGLGIDGRADFTQHIVAHPAALFVEG